MGTEQKVTCRNSVTRKSVEVPASKLQFRPAVYGVIIHESKILLSQFEGGWLLPGGAIDAGETLEQALRREISEETGLQVRHDALLHFEEDFVEALHENQYFHAFRWYYLCKDPEGTISIDGYAEFEKKHMKSPEWVAIADAVKLHIHHPINPEKLLRSAAEAAKV